MKKTARAFQAPQDEEQSEFPASVAPPERKEAKPLPGYREGRRNLSAWIDEKAFRQFKSMVAEEGVTIQDYIIKMLNDEFGRRGRPQIAK